MEMHPFRELKSSPLCFCLENQKGDIHVRMTNVPISAVLEGSFKLAIAITDYNFVAGCFYDIFVRRTRKRTYSGKDPLVIALLSFSSIERKKKKGEPGKEACQLLVILAAQVLIIGLCVGQMMA